MKTKLLLIIVLLTVSNLLKSQTAILTLDPVKNSIGIHGQTIHKKTNPLLSFEYGKDDNEYLYKTGVGASFLCSSIEKEDKTFLNVSLCYYDGKSDYLDDLFLVSLEIGTVITINNNTFMIAFDPFNWEGKIGFGIILGKDRK